MARSWIFVVALVVLLLSLANAEPQYFGHPTPYLYPNQGYFFPRYEIEEPYLQRYYSSPVDAPNSGLFRSGIGPQQQPYSSAGRYNNFVWNLLFNSNLFPRLFTLIISTTFETSTLTETTTCTTSTAMLSVCVAGRRRRAVPDLLMGSDDDLPDGNILSILPPSDKTSSMEEKEPERTGRQVSVSSDLIEPSVWIDSSISERTSRGQSGSRHRSGRFLFSFSVVTSTTTTISTYTATLTATCRSTTDFQTCGS